MAGPTFRARPVFRRSWDAGSARPPLLVRSRNRAEARVHADKRLGRRAEDTEIRRRHQRKFAAGGGSGEHTSELQSPFDIAWRLLALKKKHHDPHDLRSPASDRDRASPSP